MKTYFKADLTLNLFFKFHLDNYLSMRRVLVKTNLIRVVNLWHIITYHYNLRDNKRISFM
jgi:hypothetical protein